MWSFVPQLFYDFLARIVPGVILMATAVLVVLGPASGVRRLVYPSASANFYALGPLALLLVGAYLLGLLSGELCRKYFRWRFKARYDAIDDKCKERALAEHNAALTGLGKPALSIGVSQLPNVAVMRDHIREVNPANAARLLKVRAEKRLCEVLALGFLGLALLNLVYLPFARPVGARLVLELLLLVGWYSCHRRSFRAHRHIAAGTCHGWLYGAAPLF